MFDEKRMTNTGKFVHVGGVQFILFQDRDPLEPWDEHGFMVVLHHNQAKPDEHAEWVMSLADVTNLAEIALKGGRVELPARYPGSPAVAIDSGKMKFTPGPTTKFNEPITVQYDDGQLGELLALCKETERVASART